MSDILVVDDEKDIRDLISGILEDEGYGVRTASDADSAFKAIAARRFSLILLDIWLKGSRLDGLEILNDVKHNMPEIPVVIISGHGNIEVAVSAMQAGAYDFIEKPLKIDHLLMIVARALEAARLRREIQELKLRVGHAVELVGSSHGSGQLRQFIGRVAPTGSRILITGPAGSGKETLARLVHSNSPRANAPFVALNAASMTPDRVEAELFGVERTPSAPRKAGVFEQAHGGTLFIDEVSDMPRETQGKILRVLIDQTFKRIGGGEPVRVDVRVISASARDLDRAMAAGHFREDLYHRLNVVPVRVPSLAERRDDIPALIDHFVDVLTVSSGLPPCRINEDAMATLQAYDWPGNIRQLRNVVERLLILTRGEDADVISSDALPHEITNQAPTILQPNGPEQLMSLPLREAREHFEREYLLAQITRFNGNISRTASFIGMERSALHRKLKTLGVTSELRQPQETG